MTTINSFRDLTVWQVSMELADVCFDIVEAIPHPYRFIFSNQLIPAGISIPSNIAEGSRRPTKAYLNHLSYSLGSHGEVETLLELIHRRPNPKSLITIRDLIPNPQPLIPWRDLIPNPKSLIPRAANALITAVIAPACAVCDALLEQPLSGCVCDICWRSILPITPPLCDRCGDPLARESPILIPYSQDKSKSPAPNPQSLLQSTQSCCAQCRGDASAVDRARAVGEYEGTLREVIHALKYSGRVSLARPIAERMRERGRDLLDDVDCVVPVPLHWRREYQRGFNQAREIARHLGPPVSDVLRRSRATRAQVELAADRRRANVAGAFAIRKRWFRAPAIRGKKLLLIDDVSTTGATLEACASLLKDSGASEVFALTAARVVIHRRSAQSLIPGP